jgi:DDE family transposase
VFFEKKNNTKKKEYRASSIICKACPLHQKCIGKSANEKKFTVTYYREQYERAIARVNSKRGRYMKSKRQSTVEPVFGTLTQFLGLHKINTIGIKQANKAMQMATTAYNLKKYLKFIARNAKNEVQSLFDLFIRKNQLVWGILKRFGHFPFSFRYIFNFSIKSRKSIEKYAHNCKFRLN